MTREARRRRQPTAGCRPLELQLLSPPPRRKKHPLDADQPLTALERAAAFLDGRSELVEALKLQRGQLAAKLEEVDAMIAELCGDEGLPPIKAASTNGSKPTKVVRGAVDKCRHEVDRKTCSICAERRAMLDEAAQSRGGDA